MKEKPMSIESLVSVIIPTYNRIHFLLEAIDSVFNQNYRSIEIIVIDDGSIDGTEDVIKEKYAGRLTYVWQKNQGVSAARNYGLSLAKGKYISYLDSDDIWDSEKILLQVKAFENLKEKDDYSAVCCSVWIIDQEGKRVLTKPSGRSKKISRYKIQDFFVGPRIFAPPSNLLIRTDVLKKIGGFDEKIRYGEDWDLVLRLRNVGKICYFDQPLVYYRIHSGNAQGISSPEKISSVLNDHVNVIRKNANLVSRRFDKRIDKALMLEYLAASGWCFAYGLVEKGFDYLSQAKLLTQQTVKAWDIYQKVSCRVVEALFTLNNKPKVVEERFLSVFLPRFMQTWPVSLGPLPPENYIIAWLYYTLAFLLAEENSKREYIVKAIQMNPWLIFRPRIVKFIILSVIHNLR